MRGGKYRTNKIKAGTSIEKPTTSSKTTRSFSLWRDLRLLSLLESMSHPKTFPTDVPPAQSVLLHLSHMTVGALPIPPPGLSQHPVQVRLHVLLVCGRVLRAVLGVVVTQDGHHVVVAEVDRLVHRRVAPPADQFGVQTVIS